MPQDRVERRQGGTGRSATAVPPVVPSLCKSDARTRDTMHIKTCSCSCPESMHKSPAAGRAASVMLISCDLYPFHVLYIRCLSGSEAQSTIQACCTFYQRTVHRARRGSLCAPRRSYHGKRAVRPSGHAMESHASSLCTTPQLDLGRCAPPHTTTPVSYTHLTLPTIYSV